MNINLKTVFVKWRLQGLKITNNLVYQIDRDTRIIHSIIESAQVYRCDYNTKMHVLYVEEKGIPKKLIKFNEVFDNPSLDCWMKKYDKTISKLYEYKG